MKKLLLIFNILFLSSILVGCTLFNTKNNTTSDQLNNISTNLTNNNILNEESNNSNETPTPSPTPTETPTPTPTPTPSPEPSTTSQVENTLYEFSTTIKSKSSNRLNNINITCNTLNGTIVNPNEEFSFCKTIGKATEEKGYKKADVIINKHVEKALGGGNCQVSTTLYNALLGISDIEVTERHPHGKKVNYVPEGKDAAISYGSKDLKFINHSSSPIKIYATTDNSNVSIRIVSLS